MTPLSFSAKLERDDDGTWWYVHAPREVRQKLRHLERRGMVPIVATIGSTRWPASLMPWADGSGQIVVRKHVRDKEGLEFGQQVTVQVEPRATG